MDNPEPEFSAEPGNLRFLRVLVTVLTAVMILGVLTIVLLIVMRFRDVAPPLPDQIDLPDGASAVSFTQGDNWFAVTTDADEILIFDRVTGALRQTVTVTPSD